MEIIENDAKESPRVMIGTETLDGQPTARQRFTVNVEEF